MIEHTKRVTKVVVTQEEQFTLTINREQLVVLYMAVGKTTGTLGDDLYPQLTKAVRKLGIEDKLDALSPAMCDAMAERPHRIQVPLDAVHEAVRQIIKESLQ